MNPLNPFFAAEIERSFAQQTIMTLIGGELSRVEPRTLTVVRADVFQHRRQR